MSEENLEVVREGLRLFNGSDDEATIRFIIEHTHPDFEARSRFAEVQGTTYRGPEGVRQWVLDVRANFDRFETRFLDVRDLGDQVLALGVLNFRGKGSGVEMEQPLGYVWEIRDGKGTRLDFYGSHAEALEAVGLSD
jgi:ketosteroid isomerase-like protein